MSLTAAEAGRPGRSRLAPGLRSAAFGLGLLAAGLAALLDRRALLAAAALVVLAAGLERWADRRDRSPSPLAARTDALASAVRLLAVVVGAAVGLWREGGQAVYLALGGGLLWAAVPLLRTVRGYVDGVAGWGRPGVVLAGLQMQRGALGRSPVYRLLFSLRRLMAHDLIALLMAVMLALDLRALLLGAGLAAVFAAQALVNRALVPPRAGQARWWQRATAVAGAVGLVALFGSFRRADLLMLVNRVGPVMPLLMAIALGWLAAYARAMRTILDGAMGWGRLLYNRLVGEAFNVLTPLAGLGGDPLKILDLAPQVGTARAIRAVVLDRFGYAAGGLVFSALASAVGVAAFAWDSRLEQALVAYVVLALVAAAVLFLIATRPESSWWTARLLRLARVRAPVAPEVVPARVFGRALLWNLLGRAWGLVEIAVLLLVLGQQVRPEAVVAIGGLLAASGIVFFFVPSGLGVNEGTAVFALSMTGYGEAVGLAVGLARRVRLMLMAGVGVALSTLWRPGQAPAAPVASREAADAPRARLVAGG